MVFHDENCHHQACLRRCGELSSVTERKKRHIALDIVRTLGASILDTVSDGELALSITEALRLDGKDASNVAAHDLDLSKLGS